MHIYHIICIYITLLSQPLITYCFKIHCYSLGFKDAILGGGNLFEKAHGKSIFQYMKTDPALNKYFNKAMADLSGIHMRKILDKYEGFEGISLLVDVGGGTGASLNMIISKYPSIKGINFDLPQVIQQAPSYPGTKISL